MRPYVILSGFADEGPESKNAEAMLAMCRAVGLSYYSPRFVDCGNGVKNLMALTDDELKYLADLHQQYEMKVATIGSPIGKVLLKDVNDGTNNKFVAKEQYLSEDVPKAIKVAQALDAKLLRGFSFYPPKGDDPKEYVKEAASWLKPIVEQCTDAGVFFGLEVEANLVGSNGELEMALYNEVGDENMMLIFDGANISCQGYTREQVFEQYRAMKDGIGWMHVKDYARGDDETWTGHVDEEMLRKFVPIDRGSSGYFDIFVDFKDRLPALTEKLQKLGLPGVFLDLEPHLKGGGQFGGFSGPDGFGVALRVLCRALDAVGIGYDLTTYDQLHKNG